MTEHTVATATTSTLAVRPGQDVWTDQQRAALAQIGVDQARDGDLAVFLNYAQRTGLDPFSRQLYMISRWDNQMRRMKWTIQASIDGLRIVAQRSGEYAGQVGPHWCGPDGQWTDVWLTNGPPSAARVGVLRSGFAQPLYAVALMREYVGLTKDGKPTRMWSEKGALMLAKCAEALALRKAFPHDLSGIYTAEEMTKADVMQGEVVPPRDFRAEADACTDPDELRMLWLAAGEAGVLGDDLQAHMKARAAIIAPETATAEPRTAEEAVILDHISAVHEAVSTWDESAPRGVTA